jgi:non-ribosomal peptide synthetase component F
MTGDGVRLERGDLSFLGRMDRQIKIDGFRVEPAEVQTTIARLSHAFVLSLQIAPRI